MKPIIKYLLASGFLLIGITLFAQRPESSINEIHRAEKTMPDSAISMTPDPLMIAYDFIQTHLDEWGLHPGDIENMTISDMYTDRSTGITRIYFLQHYKDIPVYNAILNLSITKEGQVFFYGNRFIQGLKEKINTAYPSITAGEAIVKLASHLDIPAEEMRLISSTRGSQFVFEGGQLSREEIPVKLCYQPYQDKAILAWDVLLSPPDNQDKWSTRIDAVTGGVLGEDNWTVYCFPEGRSFSNTTCENHEEENFNPSSLNFSGTGAQYNVWPAPVENPSHGPRTIVGESNDTLASPFGWHDVNGQTGPEYTITRGNNVHAFEDREGVGHSTNNEPDGGSELLFDFPFDPALEPDQYADAAVVNLFYWINYMHDFTYHFGFTEEAGNFQQNNYGKGGKGNDALLAMTQYGANKDIRNNAFYSHALDGGQSRIQMQVFYGTKSLLNVNAPAYVAGTYQTSYPSAGWGAGSYLTNEPVSGEVVKVDDGIENPFTSDACEPIVNTSELQGKIALIDRGGCQFGWKALQAQNAGAIGIIVCNFDNDNYTMNPGADGQAVHIPIVMVGSSDCQSISQYIESGLYVTLVDSGQIGPAILDSDLENEIIVHEFAHGITNRLTGGPNTSCLKNAEEMSEGWSDFFAIAMTVQPGDTGERKRGFATYVFRDKPDARGFRRYPYSTDMNIMPLTYADVESDPEEHNLGEVWAAALWDMYWALVDQYGWSNDPYDPSSGNYRALKLVFDGLKNTPCSPGFTDGRDAILAADESLYNGDDVCLIWEVFARRGIGYTADQGSPEDAGDQQEAFDVPPSCTNKILIEKSVTDFIQAGDEIEVTLRIGNYKPVTASNVKVEDEIPFGTSFKPNSSNLPCVVDGQKISFNIGSISSGEDTTITYKLSSNPSGWSKRKFLDTVSPDNNTYWLSYTIGDEAENDWRITNAFPAYSGDYSWHSEEVPVRSRQALELNADAYTFQVQGDHPALRFYHRYDTKAGMNGGVLDVKEIGTNTWTQVSENMLRHGYTGTINYRTFISPDIEAFSGNSGNTFKATYVDLSEWTGKEIQVRFRFGTDANTNGGTGWLIDDVEFMDLVSYNGEACVTTAEGDYECAVAPEAGTIVDSKEETVGTTDPEEHLSIDLYPNPANDILTLSFSSEEMQQAGIGLFTLDGKPVIGGSFNLLGKDKVHINTSSLPSGLYLVKVNTTECIWTAKVIIQK